MHRCHKEIFIILKYRLTVVASLCNMMWISLGCGSCYSWHEKDVSYFPKAVNNNGRCPYF